jgi:hypothetical protein
MKKNKPYLTKTHGYEKIKEQHFGVPPEELNEQLLRNSFNVYKSAKKGQSSFRITKSLLDSLIDTSLKIQKHPTLIISIGVDSGEYILTCNVTKK